MMPDAPAVFAPGLRVAAARTAGLAMVKRGGTSIARAICAGCGAKDEQDVDHHMMGPVLARFFESLGWNVDAAGQATCPNCIRNYRPVPVNATDRPHPAHAGDRPSTDVLSRMVIPMSKPASSDNAAPRAEQECRDPTMPELRNIMAALESWFVDGVWTEGKSDQAIAAELDLPRRMVEKVRIEAFGHIRNAELEQLKQDANALKAQLTDLFRRIANLEAKVPK